MLLRFPELPACEPSQQDVLVRALQLVERRQQVLTIAQKALAKAKSDDDRTTLRDAIWYLNLPPDQRAP